MLSGGHFPLYSYGWRSTTELPPSAEEGEGSMLNSLIMSKWEDCLQKDLFRYDVTACETKVLPGTNGFVAQLNEGRHTKKRPTEFRVDRVLQTFDPKKFNFTKVAKEEVLFRFEESETGVREYQENAPIDSSSSPNVVVINVSPIEYGHILLVPRVMDQIPQRIDPDTLLLALHMIAEVRNPWFRVGFNSLGAFATINQLHFQAYYLQVPFALERAPTKVVVSPVEGGVKVSEVFDYPVRCLVFEIGSSVEELADDVAKVCMTLQEANQPYNVLITDGGARVFVIPQCFAERQANGEVDQAILDIRVNPAVWEISGHMILFRREDYEQADEEKAWKLLAEVSLSEERFDELKNMCLPVPSEENITNAAVADAAANDSVKTGYRNIGLHKAKVRKTMELKPLCQECILPRA